VNHCAFFAKTRSDWVTSASFIQKKKKWRVGYPEKIDSDSPSFIDFADFRAVDKSAVLVG
jgi:hypothetical protein